MSGATSTKGRQRPKRQASANTASVGMADLRRELRALRAEVQVAKPPKRKAKAKAEAGAARQREVPLVRTEVPPYSVRSSVHDSSSPARVKDYLLSLAHPRMYRGVRSPNSLNVAPTTSTLTATTVARQQFVVQAGTSDQVVWFPGHTLDSAGGHPHYAISRYQSVTAALTAFTPGPVTVGGGTSLSFVHSDNVGANLAATSTAVAGATAYTWDTVLPITAPPTNLNDLWWRAVSCSLMVTNVTSAMNISGSVVSVVPGVPTDFMSAATVDQEQFSIFPTYTIHDAGGSREIVWVPRTSDLGYWGMSANGVATKTGDTRDAGIWLWMNAGAADQTFIVELVVNWEIGGNAYRMLQKGTATSAAATDITKAVVGGVHSGLDAAQSLWGTASRMASGVRGMAEMAAKYLPTA